MKFKIWWKKWIEDLNKTQFKDWKFTWKDIIWFWGEWIWKFMVICVTAIVGCFIFAQMNDTLANYEGSSIYGSWMWWVFIAMYFGVLLYIIYRIGVSKK